MPQLLLAIWVLAVGCAIGLSIWILVQSLNELRNMREQDDPQKPD